MEGNTPTLYLTYLTGKTSQRECPKANCGRSPAKLPQRYASFVARGYVSVYLHTVVRLGDVVEDRGR